MKVFIVSSVSMPNGMASTKRILCLARALLFAGVHVEVITYFRTERYGVEAKNTLGEGICGSVPFRYIGGTPLRSSNVIIRRLNDILDRYRLLTYLKKELRPRDIVYMYDGNSWKFSCRLAKLTHKCGAFYVKDLCELPYGDSVETKLRKANREKSFSCEFPLIDAITPISSGLYEIAKKYTRPDCMYLKVPILVDFEKYKIDDKSKDANVPYIFHSGTLTEQKDGILGIIEAFGKIHISNDTRLKLICTGYAERSIHREKIKELIKEYQIEDYIRFTGYLSEQELKDYLSKAALVIINKYENMQNYCCFSTKLGEYLAACKPVILTDYGEASRWISNMESGYIIKSGDNQQLQNAILHVLENPDEVARIAENGQRVCRDSFDYKVWGEPLKKLFESL